jgi:hypothetical protein
MKNKGDGERERERERKEKRKGNGERDREEEGWWEDIISQVALFSSDFPVLSLSTFPGYACVPKPHALPFLASQLSANQIELIKGISGGRHDHNFLYRPSC